MASTIYCMAVAFMLAAAVVQANQWTSSVEGLTHGKPNNVMSLLQMQLQKKPGISMLGLEANGVALMDMMKDPNAMLATLENMVRSGEKPAFELISMIRNLILDDIMPGLQATQDASALKTTELLNAFRSCNNASQAREGHIKNSTEKSVDNSRSLHATCRDVEKVLHGHNLTHPDSYCNKLGDFLSDANGLNGDGLHIPDGSARAGSVEYVKSQSNTNMCAGSEVTQLDDLCTAKEDELKNKTAECLTKQVTFEAAFCKWEYELEANCVALDACYTAALTAYNKHVDKTRLLVEKWDIETTSLHKILCYCNVWLSDNDDRDNRSQHNASQFEACKTQTHVPDSVSYGTPPEKVACLLTDVENHPGTQGFINQEYSSFIDFVATVIPCTQGTTTSTEATTTEAPTTEFPLSQVEQEYLISHVNYTALESNPAVKADLISAIKEGVLAELPDDYTDDDITVTFEVVGTSSTVLMEVVRATDVAMNISVKAIVKIQELPNVPLKGAFVDLDAVDAQVATKIQGVKELEAVLAEGRTVEDVSVEGKAIKCGANEKVEDHVCVACPVGKTSTGGHDATGSGTTCEAPPTTTGGSYNRRRTLQPTEAPTTYAATTEAPTTEAR